MITGSLVAIVTPMREDGALDLAAFRKLIDWHVAEGTDGIVVGTTGESLTVDLKSTGADPHRGPAPATHPDRRRHRWQLTAEAIDDRIGQEGGSWRRCPSPYYNKPMQEGLYRHWRSRRRSTCR
jgi:4-hydroxy-tetrahydrodipicolinate synthase